MLSQLKLRIEKSSAFFASEDPSAWFGILALNSLLSSQDVLQGFLRPVMQIE
jgi:hypothetical protein